MKLRQPKIEITDNLEREAVDAVRRLAQESGDASRQAPSETHFANLIVKTNEKIDYVTSGKALSISWLARVAVPGVVAILFFFIGLHYYAPDNLQTGSSVAEAMKSFSSDDLDSLVVSSASENSLTTSDLRPDLFNVSNEQLSEYYVASQSPAAVLEELTEQQQMEVAAILESGG